MKWYQTLLQLISVQNIMGNDITTISFVISTIKIWVIYFTLIINYTLEPLLLVKW